MNLQTTWYRWIMIVNDFNMVMTLGGVATSLATISTLVAEGYDVSISTVNASSIVITVVFIPMQVIAIKMFESMDLACTLSIAALMMLVGCWIRQLV